MEARRSAEWQDYWRRAAFARAMQQQQMQQQVGRGGDYKLLHPRKSYLAETNNNHN